MNVEVVGDLDKLNAVIITQAKKADGATNDLNAALKKQSELLRELPKTSMNKSRVATYQPHR